MLRSFDAFDFHAAATQVTYPAKSFTSSSNLPGVLFRTSTSPRKPRALVSSNPFQSSSLSGWLAAAAGGPSQVQSRSRVKLCSAAAFTAPHHAEKGVLHHPSSTLLCSLLWSGVLHQVTSLTLESHPVLPTDPYGDCVPLNPHPSPIIALVPLAIIQDPQVVAVAVAVRQNNETAVVRRSGVRVRV